ncbi:kinase-like domain-containing protein [Entophlyctis helioformis]|nr:kinase-like domain-containing protein [Entophlyctis helioformis]
MPIASLPAAAPMLVPLAPLAPLSAMSQATPVASTTAPAANNSPRLQPPSASAPSSSSSSARSKSTIISLPLTPEATIKQFKSLLTPYELEEIKDFPDIYFAGAQKIEKIGGPKRRTGADLAETSNVEGTSKDRDGSVYNSGFDDSRGDLYLTRHDHVGYRYEILSLLGKGSFGQVLKCYDHKTKTNIALKIIRNKTRFEKQGAIEVKVLRKLRDEDPADDHSLVHILDHFYFRGHLCLTFELLGANLYEWLKAGSFKGVHLGVIRRLTHQMLKCLQVLQRTAIVHCDLKPENVLLKDVTFLQPSRSDINYYPSSSASATSRAAPTPRIPPEFDEMLPKYDIKVIDFGSSCFENERLYTYVQSRFYRSPEVILGIPYRMAIDMWSLGCILAELYTGYPLFPGENEKEQLACIMEIKGVPSPEVLSQASRARNFFDGNQPIISANSKGKKRRPSTKTLSSVLRCTDMAFLDFIDRCLCWDASRRMTPFEAMRHPYITGARFIPHSADIPVISSASLRKVPSSIEASVVRGTASLETMGSLSGSSTAVASIGSVNSSAAGMLGKSSGLGSGTAASVAAAAAAGKPVMSSRMKFASAASIPSAPSFSSSGKSSRVMTAPAVDQYHLDSTATHPSQLQRTRQSNYDQPPLSSRGLLPVVAGQMRSNGRLRTTGHGYSTNTSPTRQATANGPSSSQPASSSRPYTTGYTGNNGASNGHNATAGGGMVGLYDQSAQQYQYQQSMHYHHQQQQQQQQHSQHSQQHQSSIPVTYINDVLPPIAYPNATGHAASDPHHHHQQHHQHHQHHHHGYQQQQQQMQQQGYGYNSQPLQQQMQQQQMAASQPSQHFSKRQSYHSTTSNGSNVTSNGTIVMGMSNIVSGTSNRTSASAINNSPSANAIGGLATGVNASGLPIGGEHSRACRPHRRPRCPMLCDGRRPRRPRAARPARVTDSGSCASHPRATCGPLRHRVQACQCLARNPRPKVTQNRTWR